MAISNELFRYVADGDLHRKLDSVPHSTNLREVVTVGHMIDHHSKNKA
ncbi:hypothetical protein [Bacillus weihaiensis]|nr:hypothetical protein [Bacillus weihaiensis]